MSLEIKRERGGIVTVALDPHEIAVVRHAFGELVDLLDSRAESAPAPVEIVPGVLDPFAESGTRDKPADPALARLLPNAYGDEDPGATGEFRRYTEADLVAYKRGNAETLLATLGDGSEPIRLEQPQVRAWLYSINDLRLTLGVRLDIDEGYGERMAALEPDDPQLPAYYLYEWLSALQDGLVRVAR